MEVHLPVYDDPPPAERVRGLLCSDGSGQLQVVVPERALVEPARLQALTEREVRALPPDGDKPVCAIPGFYGIPSVVHTRLKHRPRLALATEVPGRYVRITGPQLCELCAEQDVFDAQFPEEMTSTPASADEDVADIHKAVSSFTERRIRDRLDDTLHIPPLPEAAQRIVALQRNPNCELKDLVRIVETDPAIAARIMGWANSARYGLPEPVQTLEAAIMRCLGFDMVFNMALGMALGATLNLPRSHVTGASNYWLEAVYRAAVGEALAHQFTAAEPGEKPNPGTCYLIGLLANFGTLVLGHVFPPQYDTICRMQEANPHICHTYIDQHVLSLNREVLAARLFKQWELPDVVSESIRNQAVESYSGPYQQHVQIMQLARHLVTRGEAHSCEALIDTLGLAQHAVDEVLRVIEESREDLGDLARAFS